MSRLLWPPAGDPLVLVLYGFETQWYHQLDVHRREEREQRQAKADPSLFLPPGSHRTVFGQGELPLAATPRQPAASLNFPDVLDEREARVHRLDAIWRLKPTRPDEPVVSARLVCFTRGGWAFFTETHSLWLATEVVETRRDAGAAALVRIAVDVLQEGDILLLQRGSDRDVIRVTADRNLPNGARETALLWQSALRRHAAAHPGLSIERLTDNLAALGCVRTAATFHHWLESDEPIGPHGYRDGDLVAIAELTGDEMLQGRLSDCRSCIALVRREHLAAAERLRRQIQDRIASSLDAGTNPCELGEIEPGVFLVDVTFVDDQPQAVPRNQVNRLFFE